MKTIKRISGAVFALSLFWAWGTVGLADMGELHTGRLIGLVVVCAVSGIVWVLNNDTD